MTLCRSHNKRRATPEHHLLVHSAPQESDVTPVGLARGCLCGKIHVSISIGRPRTRNSHQTLAPPRDKWIPTLVIMGKKNKKDKKKKGKGMEKTMAKLAKKEQRRGKKGGKAAAGDPEDDIDAILALIASEQKANNEIKIEPCEKPSPRVHASFTAHPLAKDKIILFGGEFYDGRTDRTFGDLMILNTSNSKWSLVSGPGAPLPRLAHQAAAIPSRKGELWIFGGHFNSPKQGFRHQNELWVLHLKDYSWEKVNAKVAYRNKLIVFGGYYDSPKTCLYYNDLFIFDTGG
eukprot:jgi/Bigna1/73388/fgenesh1_pg.24_\